MNRKLVALRKQSYEAEVILANFASRKRVHKDKEIHLPRLYNEFYRKGIKLSRHKFDEVFEAFEQMGYGLLEKSPAGDIVRFLPDTNIKVIGMDSQEPLKPIQELTVVTHAQPVSVDEMVLVVVVKNGKAIRMHINKDDLEQVTNLVG